MNATATLDEISRIAGRKAVSLSALSGGCVGDVFRVGMEALPDLVVKLGDAANGTGGGLDIEGRSLEYLKANSFLVPQVLFRNNAMLLMEYVDNSGSLGPGAQEMAGRLVAGLHNVSAPQGFGFEYDTVIGGLPQPNPWNRDWVDFFAQSRLNYMAGEAYRAGRLDARLLERIKKFSSDLSGWLTTPEKSSLVHGDMWTGNVLAAGGRITGFIDPAIYYADAEIELAFTQMFGTFNERFFAAYREVREIKPGFFEERLSIYNLYPLLVHVRLFGGGYVNSVDGTLRKFGY